MGRLVAYAGPKAYFEQALADIQAHFPSLEEKVGVIENVNMGSRPDYRAIIDSFVKMDAEAKSSEPVLNDLFAEQPPKVATTFDELNLDDKVFYAARLETHQASFDYLLWLAEELGPIDSELYNQVLVDRAAMVVDEDSRAKQLLAKHQGFGELEELLETLDDGEGYRLAGQEGGIYNVAPTPINTYDFAYTITDHNSGEVNTVYGHDALAVFVFQMLDVKLEEKIMQDPLTRENKVEKLIPERPNRKLGLSTASFITSEPHDTEVMAVIALANLKKGEWFALRNHLVKVETLTEKTIALRSEDDNIKVSYRVPTEKFQQLVREVGEMIAALHSGANNPGLVRALERDPCIIKSESGGLYISETGPRPEKLVERSFVAENGQKVQPRPPSTATEGGVSVKAEPQCSSVKSDQVLEHIKEMALAEEGMRTVIFKLYESKGSLDGSVCGVTEDRDGQHNWFLLTKSGRFHSLSQHQTKELCGRINNGVKRKTIFDTQLLQRQEQQAALTMAAG